MFGFKVCHVERYIAFILVWMVLCLNCVWAQDALAPESGLENSSEGIDKIYAAALFEKYNAPHAKTLVIKEEGREGNFIPSAMLTETDRRDLLGAVDYSSEIAGNAAYLNAAKNVILWTNPLDGGKGIALERKRYVYLNWDVLHPNMPRPEEIKDEHLGNKGFDLFFHINLQGYDEAGNMRTFEEKVRLLELKILQTLASSGMYGGVIHQEVVDSESVESINEFLDSPSLLYRIDPGRATHRTYREYFAEKRITLKRELLQYKLPTIDVRENKWIREPDLMRGGGHGYVGTVALHEALTVEPPENRTLIRTIYNGDGGNNFPDPYIAGWMAQNKIPIVMISTTKTGLDKKGGLIGIERDPEGRTRAGMMELAQAKEKEVNQEALFYDVGLTVGTPDQQYFNTNTALINYSVLAPFLRKLKETIGAEQFNAIITPDLMKIVEKKGDREFIKLEGALGLALLNLNGFIETTVDERVLGLVRKHIPEINGRRRLLYIVNIDQINRTGFFTPTKYAFDHWLYNYSNHFEIDTTTWKLKNRRTDGHLPEIHEDVLQGAYYKDIQNCIEAFGNASTIDLDYLEIHGQVKLKDAILKGQVIIESQYEGVFDLGSPNGRAALGQVGGGNLVLKDVYIEVDKEGNVKHIPLIRNATVAVSSENTQQLIDAAN